MTTARRTSARRTATTRRTPSRSRPTASTNSGRSRRTPGSTCCPSSSPRRTVTPRTGFAKDKLPMTNAAGSPSVQFGAHPIGAGRPLYVVAEIGINHNGDVEIAKRLIDVAKAAGCDAVKFQKRTPELCVPPEQRDLKRETPWGVMTYLQYRERVEFGQEQYADIDRYCRERGIAWFTSCWDEPSVDFVEQFNPIGYKVASASLTDQGLLRRLRATGRPVILSTG